MAKWVDPLSITSRGGGGAYDPISCAVFYSALFDGQTAGQTPQGLFCIVSAETLKKFNFDNLIRAVEAYEQKNSFIGFNM